MTIREDIVLFRSFQKQILLGHPKRAFQKRASFKGTQPRIVRRFQNYRDVRTPIMCDMLGTGQRHRYQYTVENN